MEIHDKITRGNLHRADFSIIASFVRARAKVLDVGCGNGALLELLQQRRQITGRGVELSQHGVEQCLAKGLSVIQGDAERDLAAYRDASFDYVILSQTLQALYNPRAVLEQMLRIGEKVIISIPNFGYWQVRLSFLFSGRMPITKELPYRWYDTPNIHFCTIADFRSMVKEVGAEIECSAALKRNGDALALKFPRFLWNLMGQHAVFLLRR